MKVVVYDTDINTRERLTRIIKESGHCVVAQVHDSEHAVEAIKIHEPDLLLLDINSCSEAEALSRQEFSKCKCMPALIVITQDDRYALTALKAGAVDYILKPVNRDELMAAFNKARRLNIAQQNEVKQSTGEDVGRSRQYIASRTHRGVEVVDLADVYYFSADQKYVRVRHKHGVLLIDETLKSLEAEFAGRMFRIHRNALVNFDYLDLLETVDSGQYRVRFRDIPETLAVSRRHLPSLLDVVYRS